MIFGEPLYRYNAVASTQDVARDLMRAGEPAGTVVAAQAQTQGRGRRGREWHFPAGANVCLTAICPPVPLGAAWQVALLAGVAVADGVRMVASDAEACVRFPNDVQLAGRKLAGVLVETAFSADPERVMPLLGIGINVKAGPLPPEIERRAVQLESVVGREIAVEDVESAVLASLGRRWEEWETGGFAATLAAWRLLADPDAERTFILNGEPMLCRILDIGEDGAVSLMAADRRATTVPAAQVILGDD